MEGLNRSNPGLKAQCQRSSIVTAQVGDLVTFSCVHCLAELEMPFGNWDGWVRCRSCGQVFLPPDFETMRQINRISTAPGPDLGIPGGSGSSNGATGFVVPQPGSTRLSHTSAARLVFTTGFVLCLILTLIKFLDFSPGGMAIFGFLSLVFFLLLMRSPRKRLPPAGATWVRQTADSTAHNDSHPISNP
jgi:hypothetical protein